MRIEPVENLRLRHNNVALTRLVLAITICLEHAAQLSGEPRLKWLADLLASPYRVASFFILSGLLIFRSYERSTGTTAYATQRILRIYPPYAFIVLLCAVGLSAVTTLAPTDYFGREWALYVSSNLSFLSFIHPTLPGVFQGNARPEVNGALWTMKIEVMFYAAVPLFVWLFRRIGRLPVLAGTYALSIAYGTLMIFLATHTKSTVYTELARQLPGQLAYLMAGACCYYYLPSLEQHLKALVAVAVALLVLNKWFPLGLFEPLALAGVVIAVALFTPVVATSKGIRNLSYMLFLVHFPVIQLLVHFGWLKHSPFVYLVSAMTISVGAAVVLDRATESAFSYSRKRDVKISAEPGVAAA